MAVDLDIIRALVETTAHDRLSGNAPTDPITHPGQLPMDWRIDWEERAAILQYDAGVKRDEAERQALCEIVGRLQRGKAPTTFHQKPRMTMQSPSED